MAEKPNLLLFMSDQHNPHFLGCAGEPLVRTPNLDRLANQGVRFARAYCGSPLCVPSRMTFLTAQHCSDIDVWTNMDTVASDIPTFAHSLGAAGYETVLCGRMHFHGPDQRHGFEKRLVGDVTGHWPGSRGPDLGHIPMNTTGQRREGLMTAGPGRTAYQAFDRAVTDAAIEYLRQRATAGSRPFCMVVGYVLPHCPFICPKHLFEEYHARVDVPRMAEEERAGLHPAMKRWRELRGVDDVPDDVVRTARAAYYGLVTMTDAHVGEVVDALEAAGLSETTAVFYCSDHGDMAGEHEMWWKNSFYEGSVGVPLIAAWPGHFRERLEMETPVSLLDLAATLVKLGEGEPLPHARGRSLVSLLNGEGKPDGWVDEVFSENVAGKALEPPSRMIVSGPWKLIHFHNHDTPMLFNLDQDPGEIHDRAADPACAAVRERLHARVRESWSGNRIITSVKKLREDRPVLSAWAKTVRPPDPDHWLEPEKANVFPES